MIKNFGIREDYISRDSASTIENVPGDYWDEGRKRAAGLFQFDVYTHAKKILLNSPKGKRRVLDLGCGYPVKSYSLLYPLAEELVVSDQETLSEVINKDFPSLNFIPSNLEEPRVINNKFDLIICADVIEHLINPDKCLEFIRSNLQTDGIAIISTPERIALRGNQCLTSPKPEHVREWSFDEFAKYIESKGYHLMKHITCPEKKLSGNERVLNYLHKLKPRKLWNRKYNGCQMLVCRLS